MLADFNLSPTAIPKQAEFCIVGAGPAGISLALALSQHKRSVLLLEGGGLHYTPESQSLYAAQVIGDPYFDLAAARLRYLGGTSGHWGGWCRPLDASDFEYKPTFPLAYWPISQQTLTPYLGPALSILDIKTPFPSDQMLSHAFGIKKIAFGFSPPTRFGDKYRPFLARNPYVHCWLHANLTHLETDGHQRIQAVHIRNFNGQTNTVHAKHFIFALGGIENSRMLLWCHQQENQRLVDPRSPLGNYWMEHPHYALGSALISRPVHRIKSLIHNNVQRDFMALTPQMQQQLNILSCGIRFDFYPRPHDTRSLIQELACLAPRIGQWAEALAEKGWICGSTIRAAWEQQPLKENRIRLSASLKDRFGIPQPKLYWKKSLQARRTVQKTILQIERYLSEQQLGRLKLLPWVLNESEPYPKHDEIAGYHHMGGTRMASDPTQGVVDAHCRVFNTQNLYLAGSSVFPSAGHANPTLTIVQLALRLADHLLSQTNS